MKVLNRIPDYALKRADVFGKTQPNLRDGERVVDLGVNLESGPFEGAVVITETTVRQMMRKLKITEAKGDPIDPDELAELRVKAHRFDLIQQAMDQEAVGV